MHRDSHAFPARRSSDLRASPRLPGPGTPKRSSTRSTTRTSIAGAVMPPAIDVLAVDLVEDRFGIPGPRPEEHTSELQSHSDLVCRLLLEKKKYRTQRNK